VEVATKIILQVEVGDHSTLREVVTGNKSMEVMQEPPRIGETQMTTGGSLMTGMKKSRMIITRAWRLVMRDLLPMLTTRTTSMAPIELAQLLLMTSGNPLQVVPQQWASLSGVRNELVSSSLGFAYDACPQYVQIYFSCCIIKFR